MAEGLLTTRLYLINGWQMLGVILWGMQSRQALNGQKSACLGYFKNNWMCKNLSLSPAGFSANGVSVCSEEIKHLGANGLVSITNTLCMETTILPFKAPVFVSWGGLICSSTVNL